MPLHARRTCPCCCNFVQKVARGADWYGKADANRSYTVVATGVYKAINSNNFTVGVYQWPPLLPGLIAASV